jgi:hypothetical protein
MQLAVGFQHREGPAPLITMIGLNNLRCTEFLELYGMQFNT